MNVLLLNDTRADLNPGCQATVASLIRHVSISTGGEVRTRPRGEGYELFADMVRGGLSESPRAWGEAVDRLASSAPLREALLNADLVVANLEGTFHHHTVGALALGGAIELAHRMGKPAWAVNGTVEGIAPWLLESVLGPCEHMAVREPRSVRWLSDHGITAVPAADCAFSIEAFFNREPPRDRRSRAALYTPGVLGSMDHTRDVQAAIADLRALEAAGWHPVFLQMAEGEMPIVSEVRRAGWKVEHVRDIAWNCFGSYLRQFDLMVSGRYHALIFAAMAGLPAVAKLSNTFKIAGLLELLGGAIPLASDDSELRSILAEGMPTAVDRAIIRRCQMLAAANVPMDRCGATLSTPVIEGLDWTAEWDLAATLAGLRHDGPRDFRTTIDTQPTRVTIESHLPTRPLNVWRSVLNQAGFETKGEGTPVADRVVLELTSRPHPDATLVARSVSLDEFCPSTQANNPAHGALRDAPAPPTLFVVTTPDDFERLRSFAARRPAFSFSVLILDPAAGAADLPAWCRSRGIATHLATTAADLDWAAFSPGTMFDGPMSAFAVVASARGLTMKRSLSEEPIRVALFGASVAGQAALSRLTNLLGVMPVCFVDNDGEKWGTDLDGLRVCSPDEVFRGGAVDVIAITSIHEAAMTRQVKAAGCAHKLLAGVAALEQMAGRISDRAPRKVLR